MPMLVSRTVIFAHAVPILAKLHIEYPMLRVLDAPMLAHGRCNTLG
jgi:hypothetical protein